MPCFQVIVYGDLHVVELDLHTIEKSIVIGSSGSNLVQSIDHLDYAIENSLWYNQGKVSGSSLQRGNYEAFPDPLFRGPLSSDKISEPLDHYASAQHI